MDYKSENCGANIIKCMNWCINHDACKNYEMRVDSPIVYTIKLKSFEDKTYDIITTDQRGSLRATDVKIDNILQIMLDITTLLKCKYGYAVLFEVD